MKDYRQLNIWKRSHAVTLAAYRITQSFPADERFGLSSQLRRAASSVPANIAEGCGREGDTELKRFLTIAHGSACELDYHLLLATDLGYIDAVTSTNLAADILLLRRMLGAFINKLRA